MIFEDFEILEEIGEGQFASVYKAYNKQKVKVFALKRYNLVLLSKRRVIDELTLKQKNLSDLPLEEIRVFNHLQKNEFYQGIVKFYGVVK